MLGKWRIENWLGKLAGCVGQAEKHDMAIEEKDDWDTRGFKDLYGTHWRFWNFSYGGFVFSFQGLFVYEHIISRRARRKRTSLTKSAHTIAEAAAMMPLTIVGRAYGNIVKNPTFLKIPPYCTAGFCNRPPSKGPRKMPTFPLNAKKLKALAWVFGVLFSVSIVRIVLYLSSAGFS
jgi:hypothetical protein